MSLRRTRLDTETLEQGLADQMRCLATHRPYAEIDRRFAEIHRVQLRVAVGDV